MKKIKYNISDNFPINGVKFIDFTPSIIDIEVFGSIVRKLKANIKKIIDINEIDYIICPDARGFIWGSTLGIKNKIGVIPVRKTGKLPDGLTRNKVDYKTEYSVTSLSLPLCDINNKKIIFVDDVYATGGTYYAIKDLVSKEGGILVGGVVLYDVGLDSNKDIISILTSKDIK